MTVSEMSERSRAVSAGRLRTRKYHAARLPFSCNLVLESLMAESYVHDTEGFWEEAEAEANQ